MTRLERIGVAFDRLCARVLLALQSVVDVFRGRNHD